MHVSHARRMSLGLLLLLAYALQVQQFRAALKTARHESDFPFYSRMFLSTPQLGASRQDFVGDQACRACHLDIAGSYLRTAHHLTSRLPTSDSINGSFASGKNLLKTSNPGLYYLMESRPDGFYQTAMLSLQQSSSARSERIDIVIGSGRIGQTYLYWKDNRLFQLPVSYWIDPAGWINSPGYHDGTAKFDRPVAPRCLECHLTFAQSLPGGGLENRYEPNSLQVGISCERCHGPGNTHVQAMTTAKAGGIIVNPAKLTRDRQIEVCAQCHSGSRQPLLPAFSYIPGAPLDQYLRHNAPVSSTKVDVHGNQVGLLQLSRCFQESADMTCATCHNVHQVQRDAANFSTRCLQCHRLEACRLFPKFREKIVAGCVNCHMPVRPSNLIISNSNGKQARAFLRSHWIKIYPEYQTP
jgi:hypothetical protein